ncbi:MAG: hypothetical protein J0M00_23945 [Burkholderiales bacterium]|nr:hypothetical protein [Burkholderiales bacterium]
MSVPVHGLAIAAVTAVGLLASAFLLPVVAGQCRSARDRLRDRYGDKRWKPKAIDWLGVPAWLTMEILCLAFALVFTLICLFAAYQVATSVRDWWHTGAQRRGN